MIESRQNRRVKDIRRLRRRKGDHLLLEGPHLLAEALAAGIELEQVLATPDFLTRADRSLLAALDQAPIEIAPAILDDLTDADSSRGVLALARLGRGGAESLPVVKDGIYLFLAGLQDPGNLGAIVRAAEATAVSGIALAPHSIHPNHPRALRASAGSLLRLPVAIEVTPESLSEHLAGLRPEWVALAADEGSDLYADTPTPPLVLVIGAERGLPASVAARCERRLRIPLAEPVDSLNTAVAAAVTLFEIRRAEPRPR